jgi:uncharacterized repeat protein (TIGR02543 family)
VLNINSDSASSFVSAAATDVFAGDENALRDAVANAPRDGTSHVIALTSDIPLTRGPLIIPVGANITLTSDSDVVWNLTAIGDFSTITVGVFDTDFYVSNKGELWLDGICVTHAPMATGSGVINWGKLYLYSGAISGNKLSGMSDGGGVYNAGIFTMFGGEILENRCGELLSTGGGVYNGYIFTLKGGVISNNTASWCGGGVCSYGTFTMLGGEISNNYADVLGGGVYSSYIFTLSDGELSSNTVLNGYGGGVYHTDGNFTMYDGVIFKNTALQGYRFIYDSGKGGGVYNSYGNFTIQNGIISNNTATITGGGVYNHGSGDGSYNSGNFTMWNGVIANNSALTGAGGGVSNAGTFEMSDGAIVNNSALSGGGVSNVGAFNMFNGVIANNTAIFAGGGVWNSDYGVFILSAGKILDNYGFFGGGIINFNIFEMLNGVIANNTCPNSGGGILNSGGTSTLIGGIVADNTAHSDGGGISGNLESIYVSDEVTFKDNRASVAYNRDPADDALYNSQIGSNVVWTEPFTQGYNNFDIDYTYGSLYAYAVFVSGSYASFSGAGSYSAGTSVTVNAGVRDSYTFSGWTVTEGELTLSNDVAVTFIMPANNVAVTANWVPVSTSGGGSSSGGSGSGSSSTPKPSVPAPSTFPSVSPSPSNSATPPSDGPESSPLSQTTTVIIAFAAIATVTGVGVLLRKKLKTNS